MPTVPIRVGERWRHPAYPRPVVIQRVKYRTVVIVTPDGLAEMGHAELRRGWRLRPKLNGEQPK